MNILTREVHKEILKVKSTGGPRTEPFRRFYDKTREWVSEGESHRLVDCVRVSATYIWGPTDRKHLQAKLDELGLVEGVDYSWARGYGGLRLVYLIESRN